MDQTSTHLLHITFLHPRSGDTYDAELSPETTGQQAIDSLRAAQWLPEPGRGAFALALKGGASLELAQALGEQNLPKDARIQVVLTGAGASESAR